MREIDKLEFEVWYKAIGDDHARRMCAFHFKYEAEEYIESRHESIRSNYYLREIGAKTPLEIF